jgi:heme/copper-type cytochrome/quinol oxidase subunit 2
MVTLTIAVITGVVFLGLILCVVFFERFSFDKKQKKYNRLHQQMGLGEESEQHDSTRD